MKPSAPPSQPQVNTQPTSADKASIPLYQSRDLLGEGHLVFIEHQGERYRLQLTRQGKLILMK